MAEVKQVIVIRKDLNMQAGKLAAQVSHASLGSLLKHFNRKADGSMEPKSKQSYKDNVEPWLVKQFTKICLMVNSEDELLDIYQQCCDAGVTCSLIKDAGHTVFKEPTLTCLGIGPFDKQEIDKITGNLKLYR